MDSFDSNLTLSVLVTTFRRPDYLRDCLRSLHEQTVQPQQVVVVVRTSDLDSHKVVHEASDSWPQLSIQLVAVSEPGVISANNAGFPLLNGSLVAFLDDDSIAPPDWLARLAEHYVDQDVGAVGGRIINYQNDRPMHQDRKFSRQCQRIDWFGRPRGGQTYPFTGVWEVDALRGCNMSFRRELLPLCDSNIRGDGFCYELDLCLHVKSLGYRILLDGAAVNEHLRAPRREGGDRDFDTREIPYNRRFNEAYVLAKHGRATFTYLLLSLLWFPRGLLRWLIRGGANPCLEVKETIAGLLHGAQMRRKLLRGEFSSAVSISGKDGRDIEAHPENC